MSFVDLLTTPTVHTLNAVDANMAWTSEEISMIQEMFLQPQHHHQPPPHNISDKDFQISDIHISPNDDPLMVKYEDAVMTTVGEEDATSVLLSPIGGRSEEVNATAAFQQFLFDEKADAMDAFYREAIDPFENILASQPFKGRNASTTSPSSHDEVSPPVKKILAKLQAKVDALSKMYYTRCQRLHGASENTPVDVDKIKLVHALEKLRRVVDGLAKENAVLTKQTSSFMEQSARLLESVLYSPQATEQIKEQLNDKVCADAMAEGINFAVNFNVESHGTVTKHNVSPDIQYTTAISKTGAFSFQLKKKYGKDMNMDDVIRRCVELRSSSAKYSSIYCGSIKVHPVKVINDETAVMIFDVTNNDATRINRSISVMYQAKLDENRTLLCSKSINPVQANAENVNANVQMVESTVWELFEREADGGFSFTFGGHLGYESMADSAFMAVEVLCVHMRIEQDAMGQTFFKL